MVQMIACIAMCNTIEAPMQSFGEALGILGAVEAPEILGAVEALGILGAVEALGILGAVEVLRSG